MYVCVCVCVCVCMKFLLAKQCLHVISHVDSNFVKQNLISKDIFIASKTYIYLYTCVCVCVWFYRINLTSI